MDDKHGRILIVGAGLAGLALARALAQAGFAPRLIERAGGWEDAGTGLYLPANGVRALQALGLEQAVAAQAARSPTSGCWTTAGAGSPTSTWTSCGAMSAPVWPCPAPPCMRSCARVCR